MRSTTAHRRTATPLRTWRYVAAVLAFSAATVCGFSSTASAVNITPNASIRADGTVSVSPAAERITTITPGDSAPIAPGATITRKLIVMNRTASSLTTQLATADVVGARAEDVVEVRDGVRLDAGGWATLEQPSVTLKSGDTAEIAITIRIPKLVKPGSHAFAVTVTQLPAHDTASQGTGISATFRQAAIFIVDLPGNAPVSGRITEARISSSDDILRSVAGKRPRRSWLYLGKHDLSFALGYRNSGRRLLRAKGTLEIRDIFGRDVARYELPTFTIYPDGENQTAISLKKLPAFGMVKARASLRSDAGSQRRELGWVVIIPYWFLMVAGALLLIISVQVFRAIRGRRHDDVMLDDDGYDWDDEDS